MKVRLAVILGGRTCEHDVSIISGLQAAQNIDREEYDVGVIYIHGDSNWYYGEKLNDINFYKAFDPKQVTRVVPAGIDGKLRLIRHPDDPKPLFEKNKILAEFEVVMPVIHGMNGEDGTLQGMLELWNIPYTSSGVMGSSVGMDKIAMKQLFRGCGFPVLKDTWLSRAEWNEAGEEVLDRIEMLLGYPVYVKPANLGSSIGISRADDREGLRDAIDIAVGYDKRVLVEYGVKNLKEINISVLGYAGEVRTSVTEMPVKWSDFLGFDEKYLRGAKGPSQGMESLQRLVPAPVGDEMIARVEKLAADIFRALDCKGVVRIDFILDEDTHELYVGEINTIPGSLSFYLWEPAGVKFSELLDKMVEYALRASADKNRSVYSFKSDILSHVGKGAKGAKGAKR